MARLVFAWLVLVGAAICHAASGQQRPETAAATAQSGRPAPLERFAVVWQGCLTRSGLPEDESGWRWLRQQGVRTVVTFRNDQDIEYKKFGFADVLWLPIQGNGPPSNAAAERFLQFIQDPSNWPVHMHCAEGRSRTGVMAALARYAIDGWALEDALAEARTFRNGRDLSARQIAWLKQWAAQHKPASHRSRERGVGRAGATPQ